MSSKVKNSQSKSDQVSIQVILFFLIAGVVLLWAFKVGEDQRLALVNSGRIAQAVVVDKYGDNRSTVYSVLEFTVNEATYRAELVAGQEKIGDHVTILYNPKQMSEVLKASETPNWACLAAGIIFLVFFFISLLTRL